MPFIVEEAVKYLGLRSTTSSDPVTPRLFFDKLIFRFLVFLSDARPT